jgi:Ca2+/Na+ antiporter
MQFQASEGMTKSAVMLTVASGVLYAASRVAVYALARPDGSDPGRRAIGQWIPIAGTVIAAILLGQDSIAIAVIFGTSVALLTLVLGMATFLTPLQALPPSKRVWPFVLPAALLALMAGFSGHLTWWHAGMLLAIGGAVLLLWLESPEGSDGSSENHPDARTAVIVMFLVVAFTILGGYLAVQGTIQSSDISSRTHLVTRGTLAATILSPLLALPTLGTSSAVAQRGYPGRALTALVGTVLLNLCLLLPIAILLWYPIHWSPIHGSLHIADRTDFFALWDTANALPYDIAAWRIETVILIVLGFALVPISMGQWAIGRLESTLLVFGYGVYIVALALLGMRIF